jgi:hypothetical protein
VRANYCRDYFLLWSDYDEVPLFGSRHYLAGAGVDRLDTREGGVVLILEVDTASDAGGS